MLRYTFKPLEGSFPRKLTPAALRRSSPFGKTWSQILNDLERELVQLKARDGSCVIMTAHTRYDVRNDGGLRQGVRAPEHPGVVIKFDVWNEDRKRWTPMSFECDRFEQYAANVQAIAGAMEALRKVDRYAVSGGGKSGAHYEGYKALPAANGGMDRDMAAAFLAEHSGFSRETILADDAVRLAACRKTARKLHPDAPGGSHEAFVKYGLARKAFEVDLDVNADDDELYEGKP